MWDNPLCQASIFKKKFEINPLSVKKIFVKKKFEINPFSIKSPYFRSIYLIKSPQISPKSWCTLLERESV